MSEEMNRDKELNAEDLDAVSGGKTIYGPESTVISCKVTCVDDMYNPVINHYGDQCAVVTSSLGINVGGPYRSTINIWNKEYAIVQVVPSIPNYPTCNVILADGHSKWIRTVNATLVQVDYSKTVAYEV